MMMLAILSAWSFTSSRRLFQGGLVLCGLGSGVLGLGAAWVLAGGRRVTRRLTGWTLLGASLLLAGVILMFLAVHFGVSPFRRQGAA